jgi:hypothetical protein
MRPVSSLVTVVCLASLAAWADGIRTSEALRYAGTLAESGVQVDGLRDFTIKFWTDATSTDPAKVACTTAAPGVAVSQGQFSFSIADLCTQAVSSWPQLWLEVSVGTVVFPREQMSAVPYAVEAGHAVFADLASQLGAGMIANVSGPNLSLFGSPDAGTLVESMRVTSTGTVDVDPQGLNAGAFNCGAACSGAPTDGLGLAFGGDLSTEGIASNRTSNQHSLDFYTAGVARMGIDSDGGVYITGHYSQASGQLSATGGVSGRPIFVGSYSVSATGSGSPLSAYCDAGDVGIGGGWSSGGVLASQPILTGPILTGWSMYCGNSCAGGTVWIECMSKLR